MRVLVACEFSGIVREAFRRRGHDAWSCDLINTEIPGAHIQADALTVARSGQWDLMIAHPPCTHLSASGARHWKKKKLDGTQESAIKFFVDLYECPIKHIAIENPVGIMSKAFRKPDQYIQPFWFGDSAQKKTGLWLKDLPVLNKTNVVDRGLVYVDPRGHKHGGVHTMNAKKSYSPLMLLAANTERWKIRSRTFKGIAEAMADQWSRYLCPMKSN